MYRVEDRKGTHHWKHKEDACGGVSLDSVIAVAWTGLDGNLQLLSRWQCQWWSVEDSAMRRKNPMIFPN